MPAEDRDLANDDTEVEGSTDEVAVGTPGDAGADPLDAAAICPYLEDAAGPWRRLEPARSHRCRAVAPVAPIPALTQKRVCLSASHVTCEAYVAATETRAHSLSTDHIRPERLEASRFGAAVRPLPVALAVGSLRSVPGSAARLRRRPRTALAGGIAAVVMAGVLALSIWPAPAPLTAGDPTSRPRATPTLRGSSPAGGSPSAPSTTAPATPGATPPSPSPAPPGGRRYVVREGDRLRAIARRFGSTVQAIVEANGLEGRRPRIAPGQTLIIPEPGSSAP